MNDRTSDLLYMQVKKTIANSILSGELRPGDRLLTTTEMAEEFQVCHRTVQRAMSDLVTEGLVVRRPHHGSFVAKLDGERPAVPVEEQSVHVFLEVLEEDFVSAFYVRDMLTGIRSAAAVIGCQVRLGLYSSLDTLPRDPSLAGLLLICPLREEALAVKRLGIPAIQLDVRHPRVRLGVVETHHADGVMQGVRHLARLNHKRILYVHSDLEIPGNFSGRERHAGFLRAARRYNLPVEGYTVDFEKLPERLKGPEFTAVLTDGYNTTVATLDILRDYGISMPHGVSFVGYDDVELADHLATPITVVRQRLQEVGATALSVLLERTTDWRDVNIQVRPELIVRSSTMAVPNR